MQMVRHDYEIMQLKFSLLTIETKHIDQERALRSDCNSALPMLVFVVTKSVRDGLRIRSPLALRLGFAIPGAKARFLSVVLRHGWKPCPDTKPVLIQSGAEHCKGTRGPL